MKSNSSTNANAKEKMPKSSGPSDLAAMIIRTKSNRPEAIETEWWNVLLVMDVAMFIDNGITTNETVKGRGSRTSFSTSVLV